MNNAACIGYAGKLVEQSLAAYAKAHHTALPNIEYVPWAIIFGLIVSNTVGVPSIFRAGVDTYELWLKIGIGLLAVRFLLGYVPAAQRQHPQVRHGSTVWNRWRVCSCLASRCAGVERRVEW